MFVDANFDGGNIDVADCRENGEFELRIRPDSASSHAQWFYFRVLGAGGHHCKFSILNAGEASYPEAWTDGSVVMSRNQVDWFRVPTAYADGCLTFSYKCPFEVLYVALSPPYSYDRHQDLINNALATETCRLAAVVQSVQGRPVEVLQIGDAPEKSPAVWVIARQHPGEPMAEWFMEGLIERLLSSPDPMTTKLRKTLRFFLVPNMNPDGSIAGNLRTNAAGVDLNRAWAAPDEQVSPEVAGVMHLMKERGVDLFLDIHGDEEFRFVFAAGCEGIPDFCERMAKNDQNFRQDFQSANADFLTRNGYPSDPPGGADLSIACNQIGHRFRCLSMTIEMPFKENAARVNDPEGWGIRHSKELGAAILYPIAKKFQLTGTT